MNRTSTVTFPVLAAAAMLAACGSLDANTDKAPVLATLSGQTVNPQALPVSGSTRVAVVWSVLKNGQFNVAEDLPVQPIFPTNFTIQLDGPPPADVMNSLSSSQSNPQPSTSESYGGGTGGGGCACDDGGGGPGPGSASDAGSTLTGQSLRTLNDPGASSAGSFAFGTVVEYVDRNGNGKLDLLAADAGAYVDQVIATNVETSIAYFEGPIPSQLLQGIRGTPHDGYNLFEVPPCNIRMPRPQTAVDLMGWGPNPVCPQMADAGVGDAGAAQASVTTFPPPGCAQPSWLPITTPIILTVATDPEISQVDCANGGPSTQPTMGSGAGGPPSDTQPATYPDPCDPNLSCSPDGSEFFYFLCITENQSLCLPGATSCTSVSYMRPTPTPAGWPCLP